MTTHLEPGCEGQRQAEGAAQLATCCPHVPHAVSGSLPGHSQFSVLSLRRALFLFSSASSLLFMHHSLQLPRPKCRLLILVLHLLFLCSGCVVSDTEVVCSRLGPGFYLLCLGNCTWGFSDVHNCPECWCVNGQSKESTHVALVFTIHVGTTASTLETQNRGERWSRDRGDGFDINT